MKSISKLQTNEIVINKSRFITTLAPLECTEDINKIIDFTKNKFKNATHYCLAYKLDNIKKFDDDGEPSGTAGMPILNVLDNRDLDNIICIVTRYFGGIKLGAGGLVRAYTKAVTTTLDNASIITLIKGLELEIIFKYDNIKQIDYLLKDLNIISKEYDELITYHFLIKKEEYLDILEKLKPLIKSYKVIRERLIN